MNNILPGKDIFELVKAFLSIMMEIAQALVRIAIALENKE